jgi:hypothetical protein
MVQNHWCKTIGIKPVVTLASSFCIFLSTGWRCREEHRASATGISKMWKLWPRVSEITFVRKRPKYFCSKTSEITMFGNVRNNYLRKHAKSSCSKTSKITLFENAQNNFVRKRPK